VLANLAFAYGVELRGRADVAAVTAEWEEGQRRGVVGSPHFFVGGSGYFCPALDISRVDGELRVRPDVEALERMLAAALAA
jgi:2-hydroxychromene-2-carboxylate isomerase